ncbi:hypothetical protein KFE25_003779 [Diacronema lutheri]|uniref:Uncharacterized protein n=1 Tax=Diacronema lutheri TaxID=2081491 RepID=A0A8J6C4N6_DIALT|nr:hypothetical protein KFE25_003779 [Diacronema lutheri]|mmetsp:Transcript_18362/g.57205  ORF Transcript_18362/g.57205 Transcript_18362/m.57205 type:complete len:131 (-) Transcript_18362:296-688(-)
MARLSLAALSFALVAASASAYSAFGVRPVVTRTSALVSKRAAAAPASVQMAEFKYPASETLGIGKNIPSSVYAFTSLIALFVGVLCTAQSNILNVLTAESINPVLVLGSTLTLYSFFLHIAAYVQKKNNK